jgi:hypothetical protein
MFLMIKMLQLIFIALSQAPLSSFFVKGMATLLLKVARGAKKCNRLRSIDLLFMPMK